MQFEMNSIAQRHYQIEIFPCKWKVQRVVQVEQSSNSLHWNKLVAKLKSKTSGSSVFPILILLI